MRTSHIVASLLLVAGLVAGCQTDHSGKGALPRPEPLAQPERAAMQTRVFPVSEGVLFSATIAVLQDLEWKLDTVDRAAGLIRASNLRRLEPLGPREETIASFEWRRKAIKSRSSEKDQWTRWDSMVVHIEKWPRQQSRARIIISRNGSLPAMSYPARVDKRDVIINAPAKEEAVELLLPEVYDVLFKQIEQAVLDRTGIE